MKYAKWPEHLIDGGLFKTAQGKIIAMLQESWMPRCTTRMNEFLVPYGGERQFWSSGGAF